MFTPDINYNKVIVDAFKVCSSYCFDAIFWLIHQLFSVCPSFTGPYVLLKFNNTILLNQNQNGIETFNGSQDKNWAKLKKYFVNLKSNLALLYNEGPNLLASAFSPKNVKLIKFLLKSWTFPYQRIIK